MIRIDASVGRGGDNRFKDVATVQTLLFDCRHLLEGLPPIEPTGTADEATIRAIDEFQRRVLDWSQPDGRVDPGGRTFDALVRNRREAEAALAGPAVGGGGEAFPMTSRPVESYREGMRRFGANRSGGRRHAGCDLYAPVGTPIYALADGEVIQNLYAFYLGTYALEVQHPNYVARYGEIKQNIPAGLKRRARVERGQLLGYVGELQGLNMSMLHLEIFAGSGSGDLTNRANPPFMRRADLIDPSAILDRAATP
jgi:murein DD-endopeptidase MepM/ murein hydrolase activator NlpD